MWVVMEINLHQGLVLSPYLFDCVIDEATKHLN